MPDHTVAPPPLRLPHDELFSLPPGARPGQGDRTPPRPLSGSQVTSVLAALGETTQPLAAGKLRLSAARAIVPGRGHLFASGLRAVPMVIPRVSGPMALVKLATKKMGGWDFYDVMVAKVSLSPSG
jgi:hypothetical protein